MLPRIVLVETKGDLNVGSVARVMMNFEFSELFLVNPRCDLQSEDAFKMATHAKEILKRRRLFKTLKLLSKVAQESLRQLPSSGIELGSWKVHNCLLHGLLKLTPNAIIFGAEDRGLSNEELEWAQRWVRIPTGTYQTLNLAQSVAICCYELFKIKEQSPQDLSKTATISEAEINRINQFLGRWASQLQQVGFLQSHTITNRMAKLRSILYRSKLSQNDLALLEGIVSQTNWALRTKQLKHNQIFTRSRWTRY